MGAVNTTYTFTATDTITSTKMNNIIDETVMTADALLGGSGGSGGLSIADGKLTISSGAINSSRLATGSVTTDAIADGQVTSAKIADGTIVNADINASAAIAGTKIAPAFGTQNITATGNLVLTKGTSDTTTISAQTASGVTLNVNAVANTEGNIRTASNHPLSFSTANAESMRITTAGDIGVGTNTPRSRLHIYGAGQTTANITDSGNEKAFLRVSDSSTATGSGGGVIFASSQSDDTGAAGMAAIKGLLVSGGGNTTGNLAFSTRNSDTDTALTERMRITNAGNVGIGTTSPANVLHINGGLRYTSQNAAGTGSYLVIDANGDIKALGSSLRYKNSITDYSKGLEDIKQLRPVTYKFNGEDVVTAGFIAEEVDAIGMDEYVIKNSEGQPDALNYGQMVALLVNGIKELSAKVKELEEKVHELQGK